MSINTSITTSSLSNSYVPADNVNNSDKKLNYAQKHLEILARATTDLKNSELQKNKTIKNLLQENIHLKQHLKIIKLKNKLKIHPETEYEKLAHELDAMKKELSETKKELSETKKSLKKEKKERNELGNLVRHLVNSKVTSNKQQLQAL